MTTEAAAESKRSDERGRSNIDRAYTFAGLSGYSFKERLMIRAADLLFFLAIKLIGRTVKFEIAGWENFESAAGEGKVPIYTTWHDRVFLSTYFWQRRAIVVMTSQSFDGEYIARFIQRFGYGAARGSSTRGATGAVVEMVRLMRAGCPAGLMIDGPRGPRYVAKMGATLLAKKTGNSILPFVIAAERFWQVKSWDRTQIPKPFTRATVFISPPIDVRADANDETMNAKRAELQAALDDLHRRGEEKYSR